MLSVRWRDQRRKKTRKTKDKADNKKRLSREVLRSVIIKRGKRVWKRSKVTKRKQRKCV